jgi:hypothetical protein
VRFGCRIVDLLLFTCVRFVDWSDLGKSSPSPPLSFASLVPQIVVAAAGN